jgi:hypothetical protein
VVDAAGIAEALGLDPVDGPELEWTGQREGHLFGVLTPRPSMLGPPGEVRLFCTHEAPLRTGLLAQSALPWGAVDALAEIPLVTLTDARLETAMRMRVRAAERVIARALIDDVANVLLLLLDDGVLAIDDQRVWLTLAGQPSARDAMAIADRMTNLSSRLLAARVGWEADFETAIGPIWSQLASATGMRWSADRSTIDGDAHGATFEARVDGEPCRLFTEIYVEWPSLARGLLIERHLQRGLVGVDVPAIADVAALAKAFARGLKCDGVEVDALPASVLHGALTIARTGASLTIDDTGLVTRIDRVADTDALMSALFRGALAITKGLLAPGGPSGLYR